MQETRRGRPPLSTEQRDRQRLEISRHAVRLFRAQGLAATSGAQIAEAAGVSERTVWRWFRAKESCVEPLLRSAVAAFDEVLRTWPPDRDLLDHLRGEYRLGGDGEVAGGEVEDVLAVVRMTAREPALRAVWLLVQEQAEPLLTEVFARRLGVPADSVEARTKAAVVNAALRIATDDLAAAAAEIGAPAAAEAHGERLSEILRIAAGPF
ncbi:TetR/AcrR family transcriptional regulator [Pseudonocardia xishanensis]|uniref:HTH tetR-type domain-containing protein n=1 Tax=Pseudonocardia xishanensis TaxID=630995 RepID=A0ABP8RYC9_9PSEU